MRGRPAKWCAKGISWQPKSACPACETWSGACEKGPYLLLESGADGEVEGAGGFARVAGEIVAVFETGGADG